MPDSFQTQSPHEESHRRPPREESQGRPPREASPSGKGFGFGGVIRKGAASLGLALLLISQGCAVAHEMESSQIQPPGGETVFENPSQERPADGLNPIPFYGPTDPHDRTMLERWRRVLGPAVLISNPGPGMAEPEPGDSLAVLIWNIDVGSGDFPGFLEEELGYSCAADGGPSQGGRTHFAILVQEAGRRLADPLPVTDPGIASRLRAHEPNPRGDPDIVDVARMCGLSLAYIPGSRNGVDKEGVAAQDKGNAILSTLPLSDLFGVENPFETERKVTVGVTVGDPEYGLLRLVSAHLEVTSSFYRIVTTGNRTRLGQTFGLLEGLALHEASDNRPGATLMGGDFNTWTGMDSALDAIREAFPDSPEWDGQDTMGPFPADHIFFRSGGPADPEMLPDTYRRIDSTHRSDHHPRVVWLRF